MSNIGDVEDSLSQGVRNNSFGVWKGREFRIAKEAGETFVLISNDPEDTEIGFEEKYAGIFIKTVNRRELTSAFAVHTYCLCKDYKFQVLKEDGSKLLLFTSDYSVHQALQLDFIEKGAYQKWFPKDVVDEIWEEKRPVYGFTL